MLMMMMMMMMMMMNRFCGMVDLPRDVPSLICLYCQPVLGEYSLIETPENRKTESIKMKYVFRELKKRTRVKK